MKNPKQIVLIGLAVVAIVGGIAAVWSYWRPANNADFPDGTFWLCTNSQCKAETVLTVKQLAQHHEKHYGQPMMCPKCQKSEIVRADRCPNCKKLYPQVRGGVLVCPNCKTKLSLDSHQASHAVGLAVAAP